MNIHSKKGFTLIELLIVIALLGALAVGLLAALDPFEQLKKGTDTATRNTVSEVHQSIIRFFSLKGQVPWCEAGADASADTCNDPETVSLTDLNGGDYHEALDQIMDSGELKTNFIEAASTNMGKIFVSGSWEEAQAAVCYIPVAKSFQADKNTKYCGNGKVPGSPGAANCPTGVDSPEDCKSAGGPASCYWCVQ
ncbi:MAG TPA: type II secretion system protein [Candidatus Nitrosocosmicus sp.]|nr:type II secretion system protein [Candidatus Nitrosocosmicus sp.]